MGIQLVGGRVREHGSPRSSWRHVSIGHSSSFSFQIKPHFLVAPTSTLFKSAIMEIRRALSHGWVSPFVADLDPYLQCCISARASLRLRGRAASLKRCHWYKQLLVTAGSSYLPWRFFWLDVSNTTLFSAVYSNLDSLGSIFSRLCLSTCPAPCVSQFDERGISYTVPVCRVFGDHWSEC